ncbi:hypothetical protein AL532_23675 [Pseudomonas monteilii]|nr:hypothetical protein AL532_23675 [Pseudomonas monteilii]
MFTLLVMGDHDRSMKKPRPLVAGLRVTSGFTRATSYGPPKAVIMGRIMYTRLQVVIGASSDDS